MLITPARAIADRNLLGRGFPPTAEGLDSWMRWRAILKAMYGEELNLFERSLFRAVAGGREAPSRPVKFAWVIAGRRSGKTAISSAIAVTAAMGDYRKYLRYGEKATIVCLANGKLQAKIAYGFIRGAFLANPMLAALVEREGEFSLELNTGIEILVLANNYRSIRGRTILAAILDECLVAGTLVETATGPVPIENLRPGDQVWTRQGLRPVKKARMTDRLASVHEVTFSDGRTLAGTANHPVFVHGKGFVPVQSLMIGDEVLTWPEIVSTVVQRSAHEAGAEDAGPVGQNIGLPCYPSTPSRSSSGADVAGISPRMAIGRTAMASFCIARSIAQLMTSLPTTWRSITKTATERISRSLTSKLSLRRSIIASMVQEGFVLGLPNSATRSLAAASASCGTSANQRSGFARFAESRSAQPGCGRGSAAPSVRAPVTAAKAVSHGSRPASIAALKLRDWFKGERARRNTAAMNARTPSGGAATTPVRVRSVRTCADPAPVYNLQVDEVPEYFANGVLTHNCAFWRSDESANPDIETYTALVPSLVTLPNSLLIGISSAYRKSGLIYVQYKLYFGINDPDVLVVKGATRQFNPTVPQSFIEQELVRDPEAAAAEWLSEFRSDLADYIQREVIEDAVDPDCPSVRRAGVSSISRLSTLRAAPAIR